MYLCTFYDYILSYTSIPMMLATTARLVLLHGSNVRGNQVLLYSVARGARLPMFLDTQFEGAKVPCHPHACLTKMELAVRSLQLSKHIQSSGIDLYS